MSRSKIYTAATVAQAMKQVRAELGADAVIVSTERDPKMNEVRVTALIGDADAADAVEPLVQSALMEAARMAAAPRPEPEPPIASAPEPTPAKGKPQPEPPPELDRALAYHGVPEALRRRLGDSGIGPGAPSLPALAATLASNFRFSALPDRPPAPPIMLVGPAGSGKTVTAAKIAARAAMAHEPAQLIGADARKAGSQEQLEALRRVMGVDFIAIDGAAALARAIGPNLPTRLTIIDTASVNPFAASELAELTALILAARAEPVLVLAAGGDAAESAEIAEIFAAIGVGRLIVTRVDAARRLGGALAAAYAGRLAFAEIGAAAEISNGLQPLNALALARLLLQANAGGATKSGQSA